MAACKDALKVLQTAAFQDGLVMFQCKVLATQPCSTLAVVSLSGTLNNPDEEVLKGDFFIETGANSALCNQIFWTSAGL